MEISYKLEHFEGPLDLLLHLIEKNKVDIYDIPIVEITDQYLEHVRQMDQEDLDLVSDFLVMAATLIDIKSRMLLPKEEAGEEETEDPRAELVARLLDRQMVYSEIVRETGASSATISRVNRCYTYGAGGYTTILPRIAEAGDSEAEEPTP